MERQQHHQVQESHRNGTSSSSSSSCWSSYQVQNFAESNHNPPYHHFNGGPGYGSAHHAPHSGRKRGWHHHHHHHPPPGYDYLESINHAKLYVSQVPRTATEPDIRPLFEQYGNIIEVVMLKDKRTGLQQGNCFVKYSTTLEADRAIAALNNQHIFPGELVPISVKYADSEKERLGVRDKVFVAMINKEASLKEIEEIFSPYGYIEDIFIVRDEMKQSRGCGFVRFSQVDMAIAAIKALNGTYTMRGCDQPLAVRFAEPKKPRSGDSRCNNTFNGMNFGPHYHEPVARPTTNPVDSLPGHNRPNAPHFMQHLSSTSQQQVVSSVANQEPLLLSQIPVQQMRNSETSYQSLNIAVPDTQKQAHLIQQSKQISEQQQWSQASGQPRPPSRSSPQANGSNSTSSTAPVNTQIPEFSECDWSEHTCPDGYKYYYNCVTCESMWEKPKEFALFEEQVKKQVQEQNPCHQLQTCSPVLSTQQPAQPQEIQNQSHVLDQKLQLEKQSLSASWEKPKEFALFEEQVKKQVEEQNPCHQLQSRPPVLPTQQPAQSLEIQNWTDVFDQKLQLEKQSLSASLEKPKEFALLEEQVKKQVQKLNPCHLLQSCSPVLSTQQPAQPQEIQNQTHVLDQKLQPEKQSLSALLEKPKEFALLKEEVNKQVEEQNPCHQFQSCSPVLSTQQPAQPPKIQNHTHVLDQKLQLEKQSLFAPPKEFALLEEQVKKQVEEQNPRHELQSSSPVLSTQQPAQPPEIQNQTLFLDQKLQLEKQSLSAPPKEFALLEEQVKKQVEEQNPRHELQSSSPVLSTQQPAQPPEIQNQTLFLDQKLQLEKQSLSAPPKEFALLEEQVKKQVEEQNPRHELQSSSPVLSTQQPAQPPEIQNQTLFLDQKLQLEKQSLSAPPKEFALLEEQVKKQVEEQNPRHELQSSSPVLSTQQPAQPPEIQNQTLFLDQKLQLEKQSLSAPELDRVEVQ